MLVRLCIARKTARVVRMHRARLSACVVRAGNLRVDRAGRAPTPNVAAGRRILVGAFAVLPCSCCLRPKRQQAFDAWHGAWNSLLRRVGGSRGGMETL